MKMKCGFILIVMANAVVKSINSVDDQSTLKKISVNSITCRLASQLYLAQAGLWASSVVIAGSHTV